MSFIVTKNASFIWFLEKYINTSHTDLKVNSTLYKIRHHIFMTAEVPQYFPLDTEVFFDMIVLGYITTSHTNFKENRQRADTRYKPNICDWGVLTNFLLIMKLSLIWHFWYYVQTERYIASHTRDDTIYLCLIVY